MVVDISIDETDNSFFHPEFLPEEHRVYLRQQQGQSRNDIANFIQPTAFAFQGILMRLVSPEETSLMFRHERPMSALTNFKEWLELYRDAEFFVDFFPECKLVQDFLWEVSFGMASEDRCACCGKFTNPLNKMQRGLCQDCNEDEQRQRPSLAYAIIGTASFDETEIL